MHPAPLFLALLVVTTPYFIIWLHTLRDHSRYGDDL